MDVLGDVLLSLRLLASRIGVLDYGAPWGLAMGPSHSQAVFGITLLEGPLWLNGDACPLTQLHPGDTVLVMQGVSHCLRSAPGAPTVPFSNFIETQGLERLGIENPHSGPLEVTWGEGEERTRMLLIALIAQDVGPSALLTKLQPIILLRAGETPSPWLSGAVDFLDGEDRSRPGFKAAATRHVELIFTSVLREHLLSGSGPGPSWMRGLRDAGIGRAITAIHTRPEASWTVQSLATEAGMTRSTFARRFVQLIGQPPIDYLISHRMQIAYGRMAADRQPVSLAAEALGYRSERAFRAAFKARFGAPPSHFCRPGPRAAGVSRRQKPS